MACIFLIFTSQAWNMAFSFYHSLRSIPHELDEAARSFRFSPWMRFWRLEVPFAMPPLIWNMMMSMSGGWFFVVAAEAIDLGNTKVTLPGVGSYVALAIAQRNLGAIGWAIAAMFVVILVFDQLLFRPLIASADWFRLEQEAGLSHSNSWALTMMRRSRFLGVFNRLFIGVLNIGAKTRKPVVIRPRVIPYDASRRLGDFIWYSVIALVGIIALLKAVRFVFAEIALTEVWHVALLGLLTFLRVSVLIAIASLIWVPVGIYVGLRPRVANVVQPIAQFLAAFPVNLIYPIVVSGIVLLKLSPDIWLSPLMILGTQWYILFNVIVGASAIPADMRYAAQNFHVGGWLWWKRIALPAVFPFYVTGAITASGGSWNASVVSEVAEWGQEHLEAAGLGAYISHATGTGDFRRTVVGIVVMALFVVVLNRVFWKPLFARAERKFRLS
jgi:NitT/TauT family transport system permease protein